ncbi:MAG: hypothetical protein ACI91Q_000725, partial [Gammaproteobacteria bacterium]
SEFNEGLRSLDAVLEHWRQERSDVNPAVSGALLAMTCGVSGD